MLQIIEAGIRTKDTSTVTDPGQTRTADEQPIDTGMTPKQTDLPIDPYVDGSDDAGDNDTGDDSDHDYQPTAKDDTSEPAADTEEGNNGDADWQPSQDSEQRTTTSSKLPWVVGGVALTGLVVWLVKRKKSHSQTHGWTPPRFRR